MPDWHKAEMSTSTQDVAKQRLLTGGRSIIHFIHWATLWSRESTQCRK